jgi:hypothetical protein
VRPGESELFSAQKTGCETVLGVNFSFVLNALCVGITDSYRWGPRLRLRRPTSVLVIKCTTLLTRIENSYCSIPLKKVSLYLFLFHFRSLSFTQLRFVDEHAIRVNESFSFLTLTVNK